MKTLRPYQTQAVAECWQELKNHSEPILLMASVGAGKSLMLASILFSMQQAGKRALCLVNNAELVRNNAATFVAQGGKASIYCATLDEKDYANNVVFGTPQSILNGIKKNEPISKLTFNIIIVDEAHTINYLNIRSGFMRIIRHFKAKYSSMRLLGATGTAFRYKGEPIVGDECLFKKQVGNISTSWLIANDFLVKPVFEVNPEHTIDFSKVKLNSMGKFDNKQLETVISKNARLTGKILTQLQHVMDSQKRFGCMIFCSTRRHCSEAMLSLPAAQTAIITGETAQKDREEILGKARKGEIRYLINVQVLTVGVDVPGYDTLLFLRPTESLVLAVQMIGRVLRLYPGKTSALILDCAGNLDRHADWDDPIILDAIKQTRDKDQELIFPCNICGTMNSEHARRCTGMQDNVRCDYYFEWKDCHACGKQNDQAARQCRHCKAELIDPNAKLTAKAFEAPIVEVQVLQAKYWVQTFGKQSVVRANYEYVAPGDVAEPNRVIHESYSPMSSEKAKNIFYGKFVRLHLLKPSYYYPHLQKPEVLQAMLKSIQTPSHLKLKWDGEQWVIYRKIFTSPDSEELRPVPPQTQQPIAHSISGNS